MRKRYVASKRHTIQVDFDDYLHDLDKERRAGAQRARGRRLRAAGAPRRQARRSRRDRCRGQARAHQGGQPRGDPRAAREVFSELGYGAAPACATSCAHRPGQRHLLQLLPRQGGGLPRADRRDRARGRATAPTRRACAARRWRASSPSGFRAYFELLVEDRETFELMRRNAGTIRAMFDVPGLAAVIERAGRRPARRRRRRAGPRHDTNLMAAAMSGTAFEVGVRMLEPIRPTWTARRRSSPRCSWVRLNALGRWARPQLGAG